VLLRSNLISLDKPKIFMIIASVILSLTMYFLFYLVKRKQFDRIWAVLLLVGLLLYPGTLSYYGTLLLFIILQFFDDKKQLGIKPLINIPIIGIFYFLSTVSVFTTICSLIALIIIQTISFSARQGLDVEQIPKEI
jgi:hypothetical protein